jgi:cobalt-zinc-cadmium efflux system membrane fusion protein
MTARGPLLATALVLAAGWSLLACAAEAPRPTEAVESSAAERSERGDGDPHDDGEAHHEGEEHHDEGEEDGVVELTPEAVERIGLRTEPATRRALDGTRTTTGRVGFDEDRLAHVAPRVSGRLVRVPASLGDRVAAGEVLAVLDSVELGEARASYLRARARDEAARRRFERERSLREERISTEQDLLDAEAAAREAAADFALARESLRLLGLSDEEIEDFAWADLHGALVSVRAPFAGRVVEREATVGELVDPERTLFTIADLSQVWVWVDLYERDLAHVAPGARVEVRLDAWPDDALTGELAYLGDQLDPASRTLRARVDLPNPQRRLKPGMFARVTLSAADGATASTVLAIPREALQRDGEQTIVFVRTGPGRFERRPVLVGRIAGELAEIVEGVAEGDEVVTTGAFLLRSQTSADQLGGHHH